MVPKSLNRRHFPLARERNVLIGPPKRKLPGCLEHRIFALSKRKPAFGQRSTKGAAIRIFLEPIWDRTSLAYRQAAGPEFIANGIFTAGS
jgi:hypothetical protein